MQAALAQVILGLHVLVVAFNLFGLIAVPLGAWRKWGFVRIYWWRLVHLLLMAAVAVQALAGRACILTIWQAALEGDANAAAAPPLVQGWIEDLLYWDFPLWVFAAGYAALLLYCFALWRLVPPERPSARVSP